MNWTASGSRDWDLGGNSCWPFQVCCEGGREGGRESVCVCGGGVRVCVCVGGGGYEKCVCVCFTP